MDHVFKFGIEEEYFLADRSTGRSPSGDVAEAFHATARQKVECAEHELLKGQIEVATEPGISLNVADEALRSCRAALAGIAADHDLLLFAAGSHPLGYSDDQITSSTQRYERLGDELRMIAPRAAVSAMHVHVEVPDPDRRVGLINRIMPFLPLFYALSASSPFWEGRKSGLKGYRLTAFSQWPRVGLPEYFADEMEFERYIRRLKSSGFVEDSSFVWSHIRPSIHYPTIEMRVCDSTTRVEDAVAIAALYRALVRTVVGRRDVNSDFGAVERGLTGINLWRAQQYGVEATFVDISRDRTISVGEMLEETLALIEADLDVLGMSACKERLKAIVREGTSADRQLRRFADRGAVAESLKEVVQALADESRASRPL